MMNSRIFITWMLVVLSLSGCSLIEQNIRPSTDVYTLSPTLEIESKHKVKHAVILAMSPIRSSRGLMSSDIIYQEEQYQYNSYAYSQWSDSPARLLEIVLQQHLSYSSYLSAVIPSETLSHADVLLEATLLDFSHHIQRDKSSTGRVSIRVYLIDANTKTVFATKEFSAERVAKPLNAQGAVLAINLATKQVVEELNSWIEGSISQKLK